MVLEDEEEEGLEVLEYLDEEIPEPARFKVWVSVGQGSTSRFEGLRQEQKQYHAPPTVASTFAN